MVLQLFCPKEINEFRKQCLLFAKQIDLNQIYYREYRKFRSSANRVIVLSASFQDFLVHLFPDSIVIGTQLDVDQNGRILGIKIHPFREEKHHVLLRHHINYVDLLYTDSKNDAQIMKISKEVIWTRKGKIIR